MTSYIMNDHSKLIRRLRHSWRRYFGPGDVTTFLIAIIIMVLPLLSLNAADWPFEMGTVLPILLIGIVINFLLARSQRGDLHALIVSSLFGVASTFILVSVQLPGDIGLGANLLLRRVIQWVYDAITGGINQDELIFTLMLSMVFWYLAYNTIWHIFRLYRTWRVILPLGLIVFGNIMLYTGDASLDPYAVVFVLLSLMLIVRSNLDFREWDWYVSGMQVPGRLRRQFIFTGAGIALLAFLVAWGVPTQNLEPRLDDFQEFLQSDPFTELSEFWNRLVAPIESEGPATADYFGGDSLNLGGAIRLGEEEVFRVSAPLAPYRYYWRSRVFERYEGGQWAPSATYRVPKSTLPVNITAPPEALGQSRQIVDQFFTMSLSATRLVYAAPQTQSIDVPSRLDLNYIDEPTNQLMNVSVIRPQHILRRGDTYHAVSALTTATADELRGAGISYPSWVTDANLYIGASTTDRTLQLALQIVNEANATTPYDKAKAIERWLRANIAYNESIPGSPPNQDPVDWFLFEAQQGYCTYYSSAMIVMVRSLGIPARMAAGFAQGDYDVASGQFIVQEQDAHTWVEVFFPGYGWVEFEPTSGQESLDRIGDTDDDKEVPTPPPDSNGSNPPPTPTATFTPTPPPTLTPVPQGSPTPQNQENDESGLSQDVPTLTPTPSPTPTVTPFIVPTLEPPIEVGADEVSGPLQFLLSLILVLFTVLMILLLIVGILLLIWWWVEWRGLGGLSATTKAYTRLERYVHFMGIDASSQSTPEERRKEIVRKFPQIERSVTSIVRLYSMERYGRPAVGRSKQERDEMADENWEKVRVVIIQSWLRRFIPWAKE